MSPMVRKGHGHGKVRTFSVGVIADTHGMFDPGIPEHFRKVNHIIHAGDIGNLQIIYRLRELAPVTAVSGNVDGYERSGVPMEAVIELNGIQVAIRHILFEKGRLTKEGRAFLDRVRPDVCVFGHTHQPRIEHYHSTLLFNPGSAGPKRFTLPRTLGILTVVQGAVAVQHVLLDEGS